MNNRPAARTLIPVVAILYVIVGILAHSGVVWIIGALVVGLVAVITSGFARGGSRRDRS